MANPKLKIDIRADATQAAGEMTKLSGTVKKVGGAVGAAATAVAGAVVNIGKESIAMASDVEQAVGAVDSVFGSSADTIKSWAETTAQSMGISKKETLEMASVLGAQLQGLGFSTQQTADLTKQLTERASDMAATFGGTTAEAVQALSSLLRGERDPIEKYGVTLKQTEINARVAAMGMGDLEGAALANAQTMATLQLVQEKTALTTGQFAKESDTLAVKQQKLAATTANLKAVLGDALIPVVLAAGEALTRIIPPVVDLARRLFSELRPAIDVVANFLKSFLVPGLKKLAQVLSSTVIPAVAKLVNWLVVNLAPALRAVWNIVQPILVPALKILAKVIQQVARVVSAILTPALRFLTPLLQGIARFVRENNELFKLLAGILNRLAGPIAKIANLIGGVLAGALQAVTKLLKPFMSALERVIDLAAKAVGAIRSVKDAIGSGIGNITPWAVVPPSVPGMTAATLASVPAPAATAKAAPSIVVNVTGALDPEGVARQVRAILAAHDRRTGGTTISRVAG